MEHKYSRGTNWVQDIFSNCFIFKCILKKVQSISYYVKINDIVAIIFFWGGGGGCRWDMVQGNNFLEAMYLGKI